MNEADTCRKYILPNLQRAGWEQEPHSIAEQRYFTAGRILPGGGKATRGEGNKADYLLYYMRDIPLAVVEAKADYKEAADGLGQAKDYASKLGLLFAYSSNGTGIVEFDFHTGLETELDAFPTPDELWKRKRAAEGPRDDEAAEKLKTPFNISTGKVPRYYQQIAIDRVVQAVLQGNRRVLVTMATGTGKTDVAFQVCWKLWSSRWNRAGEHRKPRILYLADRNFLVDDPKDKIFTAFGDARHRIEGEAIKSREMYFSTYQAIARDERRPGLYREYPQDFFDLVIVDECHRGSAKDESSWREILEWFKTAYQFGMTATPRREDNRDTYLYFGNPVYTYTLKQGIEDGFLAPYRVHRVITQWDAAGWRPSRDDLDRFGREIPDEEYHTPDFERRVALRARTEAVARHLNDFLKKTDRYAKTIIFCVDQPHADEMRRALNNLNIDLVQKHPDYVCRVTAIEGKIGLGHMANFQDVEKQSPVILTTSQLLTTGLDAPTCKNIVLVKLVNSIVEFKQIIGRGTRVREDYGKLWFNIFDYTGSATRNFADPDFDGEPECATQEEIDEYGRSRGQVIEGPPQYEVSDTTAPACDPGASRVLEPPSATRKKFYFDGGHVEIATCLVYELDPDGKQLRVIKLTDYTAEKVRALFANPPELRLQWADPDKRGEIVAKLSERGIDFKDLAAQAGTPDADSFDLLCHVAFNAPVHTRRERADRLKREQRAFFEKFSPSARAILDELLEKYAEHGPEQFKLPDVLKVPPISERGQVGDIINLFGGADKLREAMNELQRYLYAA